MQCCTGKKRGRSEPPRPIGERNNSDIALVGGPDDKDADKAMPVEPGSPSAREGQDAESVADSRRVRSSSACCISFGRIFKRGKSKGSLNSASSKARDEAKYKSNPMMRSLKNHFSNKIAKDRQFMVQLIQQGGIEEHMIEQLQEYFKVKQDDFNKIERDLIAVTLKKSIATDRKSVQLLDHLVEQPSLKRFETHMRNYIEKLKDELKAKLQTI